MVSVAQLVEHWIVAPVVVGSIPITHPTLLIVTFFKSNNFKGIDRVVPFGQALNINLIWDGYDLTKILSREIEIR